VQRADPDDAVRRTLQRVERELAHALAAEVRVRQHPHRQHAEHDDHAQHHQEAEEPASHQ